MATNNPPKRAKKRSPEMCPPSPKGGIGKRVQKRGLNLWCMKDCSRQPPLSANPFSKLLTLYFRDGEKIFKAKVWITLLALRARWSEALTKSLGKTPEIGCAPRGVVRQRAFHQRRRDDNKINSVHTRCIVKTSGFTRGVCQNQGFY